MKKIFVLAAAMFVSLSAMAAFTAGMTPAQVAAEVAQRVEAKESTESIAAAARAAGIAPATLQLALVASGRPSVQVFNALVAAGFPQAALAPATPPGNQQSQNNINNNSTSNSDTNFGNSRAATVSTGGSGVKASGS